MKMFNSWSKLLYRYMYLSPHKHSRRFAGHSKWANIKHIKGEKDSEKSNNFTKVGRMIRIAVQEGKSGDPNMNVKLAQAIELAKKISMPATTIQNFIRQCERSRTDSKPSIVELKGPGGSAVLVSIMTDNFTKSKQILNTAARKSNFTFSNGSLRHLFSHKGIIEAEPLKNSCSEDILSDAVEVGAEDVSEENSSDEKYIQFICDPEELNKIKTKLEKIKYKIISADCEYIPNTQVVLYDSDKESVDYLYRKLQENPDVINIYDNIAWDHYS